MLSNHQQDQLIDLIVATAEVIGDEIRPMAAAMMAGDLSVYPMDALQAALAQCRRELKGRLSLAAIIERIDDGHPTPNEAWAASILASDERNTVVWTGQMQAAWAVAQPLMNMGDKIAARQAFLEAYTRLVKEARAAHQPAGYSASIGFDIAGRDAALRQAASRGLLAHEEVQPHLQLEGPEPAFNPVALLSGTVQVSDSASPKIRARLAELSELLGSKPLLKGAA
ncbi:hypothetical protein KIP31_09995 [Xanthomonas campestris pv. campestris]|uniref:hypothetical protein n=1 Tax=Xanthomonas campestris TaxID=339 RepID=UPI000E319303|nr:hypothetical protein [Xanthomonas campestris]MCF8799229.1 hypothetical protein [Xanthomonas campestris pv. campestris]MCF8809648.1 hypothetical protein [Xanthomonas campestris pv. campestris]MCF8812171.1 hypothetical protein [Xanthomonas campestris pv. campestris]MDM7674541.1 hypothetical protein [Xanthomonas campestris pv. campestris]MEA9569619.1 hypothetical protein [Xanthomonas campestris]